MGALDVVVDPEVERAFSTIPVQVNGAGYDPWGFDPKAAKIYYSIAKQVFRYFHPEIIGLENIPAGRCLVVPNHSGQVPFDGLVIECAALLKKDPPRLLRPMAERWFPTLPFVNIAFSRCGVVVGDPINGKNLLEAENAILVFPEGTKGSGKIFQERYHLRDFGRGFMRLALQTGAPIVPVGVVGAEESIISIADLKPLAKMLGFPYIPVPALLPLLGPLAYLPMPTKFYVHVGEPMKFEGPFDDEDENIEKKVREVMAAVDQQIARGKEARSGKGWF